MTRYFEDLEVGAVHDVGSATLTEADIVEFGRRWDPLPQHTDPDAATDSLAGGLIASGLHTLCLSNRLATEHFRRDLAPSVGFGFSDVTFSASVFPGDEVGFTLEITGKRPSASHPESGIVHTHIDGEKPDGTHVLGYDLAALMARREPGGEG